MIDGDMLYDLLKQYELGFRRCPESRKTSLFVPTSSPPFSGGRRPLLADRRR